MQYRILFQVSERADADAIGRFPSAGLYLFDDYSEHEGQQLTKIYYENVTKVYTFFLT